MKLKVCKNCSSYTLKEDCKDCGKKSSDAHYKHVKVKTNSKTKSSV